MSKVDLEVPNKDSEPFKHLRMRPEPQAVLETPLETFKFVYPTHYSKRWAIKNGGVVAIRPIRPADEPMMVKFHETLSMNTVYSRYFYHMKLSTRTRHERLARICSIDAEQEMVLVVELIPSASRLAGRGMGNSKIIAVGRLNRLPATNSAEIAVLVSDNYQGLGVGTEILNRLLHIGHNAGLDHVIAQLLPDNAIMKRINEKLNFPVKHIFEDGLLKAIFTLELEGKHKYSRKK